MADNNFAQQPPSTSQQYPAQQPQQSQQPSQAQTLPDFSDPEPKPIIDKKFIFITLAVLVVFFGAVALVFNFVLTEEEQAASTVVTRHTTTTSEQAPVATQTVPKTVFDLFPSFAGWNVERETDFDYIFFPEDKQQSEIDMGFFEGKMSILTRDGEELRVQVHDYSRQGAVSKMSERVDFYSMLKGSLESQDITGPSLGESDIKIILKEVKLGDSVADLYAVEFIKDGFWVMVQIKSTEDRSSEALSIAQDIESRM